MNKTILIVGSGILLGGLLLYFLKPKGNTTNNTNNNNTPKPCPRGQESFEVDCLNPPCPKICMDSIIR